MTKDDTELYTAYSIIYNFHDRDNICFTWHVRERKTRTGLFSKGNDAGCDERLFTREELGALKAYLAEHHETELFIQKQEPPYSGTDLDKIPGDESLLEAGTGFYMLSEEKEYGLPFKVWAYYDLNGCPLTHDARARQEERRQGVSFVLKALEGLNVDPFPDNAAVDAVVKALYEESGYKVEQHSTK